MRKAASAIRFTVVPAEIPEATESILRSRGGHGFDPASSIKRPLSELGWTEETRKINLVTFG